LITGLVRLLGVVGAPSVVAFATDSSAFSALRGYYVEMAVVCVAPAQICVHFLCQG